jgi:8-oxo-dGTP pyrophosphatase MutT (NUDIX family)
MKTANPYETGEQKVIPAALVYVRWRHQILMIHRNSRPGDFHSGKWNGLGGKFEKGESPIEAARREVREEALLDLPESSFRLGSDGPKRDEFHRNTGDRDNWWTSA